MLLLVIYIVLLGVGGGGGGGAHQFIKTTCTKHSLNITKKYYSKLM